MSTEKLPSIVLQYGRFDLTRACLESLRAQTLPVDITLIDNDSPGGSAGILRRLGEQADRLVVQERNLGYAAAMNTAIRRILESESPYFLMLNNDTQLQPDCAERLLEAAAACPRAAQVSPMVCYPDGRLQAAGGAILRPLFEPRLVGNLGKPADFAVAQRVEYAPGMGLLVRSAAVRQAGLLPEGYFLYAEDVHWSLTFQQAGWEVWFWPAARLVHEDSASIGLFSESKAYYLTRSNVMLARQWTSAEQWREFRRLFRRKLLRQSLKHSVRPRYVRGMWRGYLSALRAERG